MTVGYEEEIKGNDVSYSLIGISDADGFSEILGLTKEDIELISQTQHPIIINYDLAQRFNWKIGDKITLKERSPRRPRLMTRYWTMNLWFVP